MCCVGHFKSQIMSISFRYPHQLFFMSFNSRVLLWQDLLLTNLYETHWVGDILFHTLWLLKASLFRKRGSESVVVFLYKLEEQVELPDQQIIKHFTQISWPSKYSQQSTVFKQVFILEEVKESPERETERKWNGSGLFFRCGLSVGCVSCGWEWIDGPVKKILYVRKGFCGHVPKWNWTVSWTIQLGIFYHSLHYTNRAIWASSLSVPLLWVAILYGDPNYWE